MDTLIKERLRRKALCITHLLHTSERTEPERWWVSPKGQYMMQEMESLVEEGLVEKGDISEVTSKPTYRTKIK